MFLSIAIPTPVGDTFDYSSGAFPEDSLTAGIRVQVNFAHRQMIGVIVEVKQNTEVDPRKLKAIEKVLDKAPLFPPPVFTLLLRIARYYHHPLGEVIFSALPSKLRLGNQANCDDMEIWFAQTSDAVETLEQIKSAPKQRLLLSQIQAAKSGISREALRQSHKGIAGLLKALEQKALIASKRLPAVRSRTEIEPGNLTVAPTLNEEQALAVKAIEKGLGHFQPSLLDGVTGSGKTEVYLAVIEKVRQQQGQVLIIVPEINLTPQLEQRFQQRLGNVIASLHSGLNDSERLMAWRAASVGNIDVIIGTRSAIFTPFKSLQLVIVDEEHDTSLKQQKGFRYHARDIALMRGQIESCPVVLGSATPSLESLENVNTGKFEILKLTQRAGNAKPPRLHLVDLRRQELAEGLSHALMEKMQQHLDRGNQVLLFLNRRGYTPLLLCHDCGNAVDCPRCASHTVWHAGLNELRCHHCGYQSRPPATCPSCGKDDLLALGLGTQKLEQVVHSCFPNVPMIRVDRDSMSKKNSLPETLAAIGDNQYRIIIGTQLLAKGHDFPNITLVGVIDVDQGLFSTDFHAAERLAQQLLQVSGRAGRGDIAGEVVIQTHQPEHPLLQQLFHHNYQTVSTTQLEERKEVGWPPFSYLALIHASAIDEKKAKQFLAEIKALCLPSNSEHMVEVLGPVSSAMSRKAGRYRYQLLLRAEERVALHQLLKAIHPHIQKSKLARQVRWAIDVDPVDMS